MSWRVVVRPEVAEDVLEAADRYDSREPGLGDRFIGEVLEEFSKLEERPLLRSRRHRRRNIRWRYPKNFPYRVIYEVLPKEQLVIIAAVIHTARHDRRWRKRV